MRLLAGAMVIAVAVAVVACGGGDEPLALTEYFQEIERIRADAEARATSFDPDEIDPATAPDELREALRDGFGEIREANDAVRRELEDIDAPPELADEHGELIGVYVEITRMVDDAIEGVDAVNSTDDLDQLISPETYQRIERRAIAACEALQAVADDNGIETNLKCAH